MTSHDVVARVRRILGGAKVGHAGTLDPDATGVLVLCIGKATKISSFLMEADKVYEGVGRLGQSTDTQDASGTVLQERPVDVTPEQLREASRRFVGRIEQIPPMYSALKVDGKKLYRLARKGVEVERQPRPVHVYSWELRSVTIPEFEFSVCCSKGTYVRTLVHDLGEAVGCGGHLARLARSRQGGFGLEDALSWEALQEPDAADVLRRSKVSPDDALSFFDTLELPRSAEPLRVGGVLPPDLLPDGEPGTFRLALGDGNAVGIGRRNDEGLHVLYLFPPGPRFGRGKRTP